MGNFRSLCASACLFFSGAFASGCAVEKIDVPIAGAVSPALIATSSDGAKAASQVMQTAELYYNSTTLLKGFGDHALHVMSTNPTLSTSITTSTPVTCGDYGEYSYTGSVNATGTYDLTLTYALCRERGYQFDGTIAVSGTTGEMALTLSGSSGFRIIDFESDSYSTITSIISLNDFRFTMTGSGSGNAASYQISPAGSLEAFDYITLGSYSVAFGGVQLGYASALDSSGVIRTTTVTVNGSARQMWTGGSLMTEFSAFAVTEAEQMVGDSVVIADISPSGTLGFDFGSALSGLEGILEVTTTTPVRRNYSTRSTSAGAITFTADGSAAAQYAASGSITVTAAGDGPVSFAGEYYLFAEVNIFGLEQVTPQIMGPTGTAASARASGSSWNATMTVTALSTGANLQCYTDVHVNYYDPADLATILWYVDWHIGLVDGCTRPPGIPFEEARDINGDSTCDAGLDINGSAVDMTSGGVEHYTATDLLEGYYVVSVNNWDCDTDVTNQVTIVIGDYMFGSYSCSYAAWDKDGSTAGAWCRVADIRVNANGTVDVLTPSSSYDPWHE